MLPRDLKPEQFAGYPPEARKLVTNYLGALQQLPLCFVPSLLRELIDYDFKFPAERQAREKELANLSSLSAGQRNEWFLGFAEIRLSPQLEEFDWAKAPAQFVEQLSAQLWSTHQLDAFRKASNDYADRLSSAVPPEPPPVPRLGITVIGQGVASYAERSLRELSRIPLPTAIGTLMVVHRPITPRHLLASPTKLSNRRAPRCCAGCKRRSNGRAWDRKRCVRF